MEARSPRSEPSAPAVTRRRSAWRGLASSFRVAWDGVVETALHQRNMRIHLVAALCVALLGSTLSLTLGERLALLLCVFLVLAAEVANSALEALVDLVTRERHHLARAAKDAGAGAVLVLATGAVAVLVLVLLHARPALRAGGAEVGRQAALGIPLLAAAAGLLVPWSRPRSIDALLAVAGASLLGAVALHTVDVLFTALAGLLFLVTVAVARRRTR